MTPDEFLLADLPEGNAELVRGEVRLMPPASGEHGIMNVTVATLLRIHVKRHRLGQVFDDGTGFELVKLPRTVRSPDAAFIRAERLLPGAISQGFVKIAPDLAVENLSPSKTASSRLWIFRLTTQSCLIASEASCALGT